MIIFKIDDNLFTIDVDDTAAADDTNDGCLT